MAGKRPASEKNAHGISEAEETLRAIRDGHVDAFVVTEPEGHRVYAMEVADLPYSVLVERMQQGAAMLDQRGCVIYCNASLANLLGRPREKVIGAALQDFLVPKDHASNQRLLSDAKQGSSEGEMEVARPDGTRITARFSFTVLSRDKSATGVLITDLTPLKLQAELTSRVQRLQDDERRRIARELHDSIGQLLVAIGMNTASIKLESSQLSPDVVQLLDDNAKMVQEISSEIRTMSHLLHPPLLDEVGLSSAIRWYIEGFAERSKIETTLDIPEKMERLPQNMEIAVFRAIQECLTNIHRHSGSSSCSVKVFRDSGNLIVEVKDAGRGIPQAKQLSLPASGGVGLRGMQERIRQIGGNMEIDSSTQGTVITARIPIPQAGTSGSQRLVG
jgi:two-component system NarL family sensor kinase